MTELYIPLWFADGTYLNSGVTTAGNLIGDGSGLTSYTSASSQASLHTLNSNWKSTQNYAFEVTLYSGGATAYAALWDITSNSKVTSSQISTSSTTATVVRSGQFTLTPGHVYGVSIWTNSGSYSCNFSDASLIVFPS